MRACGGALASLSGVWEDARGWCAWGARDPPTPLSRVARPTNRVGFSRSRSKCRLFPPSSAAETRRVQSSGRSDLPRHRPRLWESTFGNHRFSLEKKRFFGKPLATRILRFRRSALLAPAPSFLAFRIRARDESGPRAMCHNTHPSTSRYAIRDTRYVCFDASWSVSRQSLRPRFNPVLTRTARATPSAPSPPPRAAAFRARSS